MDLEWTDRLLYATLVKRLVNCHQDLAKVAKSCKVNLVRDDHLGLIPRFEDEAELRPFVEAVAGSFMGSNRRKGQTWLWLLDHVRDGRRQASPRSLGSLLARAAQEELLHPRADASRLLHPVALRTALDQVSALEIRRITEFPWLDGLKKRLRGKEIPADRRRIIGWLQHDWEAWQKNRPPAEDAKGFLENLLELGVLRDRGGDRLDVPDLYMAGLEMKRRGGVKKR